MTYWVHEDGLALSAGEGVVFIGTDDEIRRWVQTEGVVVSPVDGCHMKWQGAQMTLAYQGLCKLEQKKTETRA